MNGVVDDADIVVETAVVISDDCWLLSFCNHAQHHHQGQ